MNTLNPNAFQFGFKGRSEALKEKCDMCHKKGLLFPVEGDGVDGKVCSKCLKEIQKQ
jgi:hypothetical protein